MKKVVIVTGVSRGIGKSIVKQLLSLDSETIVYGISRSPIKDGDTIEEEYKERFIKITGDITDESSIKELIKEALTAHGRIDSIIINAGILEPVANVGEVDLPAWKKLFDVNFFSAVSLVSQCLPYVDKSNGSVIFVSSGASVKAYYGWAAYSASKAALNSFAMSVASERPKIKTITVAPGVVDTQMQVDIREKFGPESMTRESLERFTDLYNEKKLLDPIIPATIYAKLAIRGIPDELNGKYVRYDDPRLSFF
ncbi:SDR family oxidoreductase NDAI_0G05080 [Naumovozyma dairenensis CBS 421]|uniref:Benzil reductase ((S)-benzoin forming) n=1 Tax=Naumovozyma dairenensis (strain ATCC 10597 / BCRC 20456 / CBS 421 / NBRC 0211 / NRRL Y-12639) TaxID=1071378 RepID=J7S4J7_NAUDC|nr:hypothetical protein NDAI_0G05080 [Naumovozyma dairenensis CBS 421]CCK73491.1 hypothetical protein NDAI_0G05080 [Naumovozyma dairenensis CBS 421]